MKKLNESHEDLNPELLQMTVGELLQKLSEAPSEEGMAAYHIIEKGLDLGLGSVIGDGYDSDESLGEPNTIDQEDFPELDNVEGEDDEDDDFPTFNDMDSKADKGGIENFGFND